MPPAKESHMKQIQSYLPTQPVLRTNVYLLKPNIGGFRLFKQFPLLHGFTYGKGSQNMSYRWEPGFTNEETKADAIMRVKQRIECHLASLGMSTITHAVYLTAVSDDTRIVDLSTQTVTLAEKTDRGIFLPGGALFTTLPDIPVMMSSGDCHTLTVYAINKLGIRIIGLIHAGRRELDKELPRNALAHLISYYNCDPMYIFIGIVHGIGPENHTIQPEHINEAVKNHALWKPYITQRIQNGPFHFDNLRLLLEQIKAVYIPGKNIEAYTRDNYMLAQLGKSFSHRARQGRILISAQLI